MSPEIPENSFLVFHHFITKHNLKVGKKVRVKHPVYGQIIKEIMSIDDDETYWLKGLNKSSINTLQIGPIRRKMISGIMYLKIKA